MLKLYNSLSNKKELFVPIDEAQIKMYVCGPTLYDDIHLGNARPLVVFDVLYRLLKHLYPNVIYVRNITDVDDKIINRAKLRNISTKELTEETIAKFYQDVAKLNCLSPTFEPKATDFILQMQDMITTLINKGFAYEKEGHVFFDVSKYGNYGALSKLSSKEMLDGVRIEVLDIKKNPSDFVLWKPSLENVGWQSPWGEGRPGWHIECSAMSKHYLGEKFDIHGGGRDLLFPHHENEIAQSVCSCETLYNQQENFVNYWLHNGFITIENTKMSKSLGNFISASDAIGQYNAYVVRFMLLSTHYRQNMDFNSVLATQSFNVLDKFYKILLDNLDVEVLEATPSEEFLNMLYDDINVAGAISILHRDFNLFKVASQQQKQSIKANIIANGELLGLDFANPQKWFDLLNSAKSNTLNKNSAISQDEILDIIAKRNEAKANKDFKKADELRDYLKSHGIVIKDTKEGTSWELE
jgi:cysteinyl-tRNA synthetase